MLNSWSSVVCIKKTHGKNTYKRPETCRCPPTALQLSSEAHQLPQAEATLLSNKRSTYPVGFNGRNQQSGCSLAIFPFYRRVACSHAQTWKLSGAGCLAHQSPRSMTKAPTSVFDPQPCKTNKRLNTRKSCNYKPRDTSYCCIFFFSFFFLSVFSSALKSCFMHNLIF